ncbi:MAG: dihydroorotate dehydrogenase-like protein [Bacteroidales bacterium]|nr:dihydroorotate dehydrogenase-like protein [Bacteroidales bacterium]
MIDTQTAYLGLPLKNPVIAGSSGMTGSLEKLSELQSAGAGAVVIKSLFEEQIMFHAHHNINQSEAIYSYPEAMDYIGQYSRENDVSQYLNLIRKCKETLTIPVIASINCVSSSEWTLFAKRVEEAGADALELNIFILPSDPQRSGEQNEKVYFDIVMAVLRQVSIPVSVKISYYFSSLAKTALKLSWTGIRGIVLFNRFYSPDIDIEKFEITPSYVFSSPEEIAISLRWVAMLSGRLHCDVAASTGIHDGTGVVKQLLAGAKAVQITSALYKNGIRVIPEMLQFLESWMKRHGFSSISEFNGKMNFKEADNPAAYERVQFMRYFAGIE